MNTLVRYVASLFFSCFAFSVMAADTNAVAEQPRAQQKKSVELSKPQGLKPSSEQEQISASDKKIQSATINLQTTVTGNQEQPKVLYILPWQSPQTEDVDFESIENQQKAVFEHVERDELRRALTTQTETELAKP